MLCKAENRDPAHCLLEGRRVTRCAADLYVVSEPVFTAENDHEKAYPSYATTVWRSLTHLDCLEKNNQVCLYYLRRIYGFIYLFSIYEGILSMPKTWANTQQVRLWQAGTSFILVRFGCPADTTPLCRAWVRRFRVLRRENRRYMRLRNLFSSLYRSRWKYTIVEYFSHVFSLSRSKALTELSMPRCKLG